MGIWDALLATGMPGVIEATLTPARGAVRTGNVQWWRELGVSAEGDYRVAAVACQMQGNATMLAGLQRGDRATVAGVEYKLVTDAETDDHDWYKAFLEPVA